MAKTSRRSCRVLPFKPMGLTQYLHKRAGVWSIEDRRLLTATEAAAKVASRRRRDKERGKP